MVLFTVASDDLAKPKKIVMRANMNKVKPLGLLREVLASIIDSFLID